MDASVLYVKQVEYLQETKRTLEEKVMALQQKKEHVSTEVANLSLKNRELCEELNHIDNLAKRLEMDKDRVLETADTELQGAKVSMSTSKRARIFKQGKAVVGFVFFSNRKSFRDNRRSLRIWRILSPEPEGFAESSFLLKIDPRCPNLTDFMLWLDWVNYRSTLRQTWKNKI